MRSRVTPEAILGIPEFQGPWPDALGRRLLYIERKFHIDTSQTSVKLCLLEVEDNTVQILREGSQILTALWAKGSSNIVLFEASDDNKTNVLISRGGDESLSDKFRLLRSLPARVTGLACVAIQKSTKLVLAFSATVTADGRIYCARDVPTSRSTGREYTTMPVRANEAWVTSERLSVFCAVVDLASEPPVMTDPWNILTDTDQVYKSFGGLHLTDRGIAIVTGAHVPNPAETMLTVINYVPMAGLLRHELSTRRKFHVPGFYGASTSPRLSEDGRRLIFLQKKRTFAEDDRSFLIVCDNVDDNAEITVHELRCETTVGPKILFPLHIQLAADEKSIFFTAEDCAMVRLFRASLAAAQELIAEPLTDGWSVSTVYVLSSPGPSVFITGSEINLSRRWAILETRTLDLSVVIEGTQEETELQLQNTTFQSIAWPGADDRQIHAWLVKPSNFDPNKKYPLLYFIHGGPNVALNNEYATGYFRNWNFALFAEQGFIVVAPNASGSTGFGPEFVERVKDDWGGKTYIDHVKGFEYIQNHLVFVDTDSAVAIGASFGGYMINWIQGQSLGRRFKALVNECGPLNLTSFYGMDVLWFEDTLGGPMYKRREGYDKHNPINHIEKWATPELVIANEKDYRVPVTEGIAAFQILQAIGVESRFLSFPDEGHVVVQPDNRLHWWRVVIEWCLKHTLQSAEK
ncbi:Peptidase_S9 domain-containing protein [Penicillium ucsense]|uniref:Dipeptidyl-peptidase V n=1 Tax=Penicillium ucsense TaxID=2839758 RepID=A0A8J8W8I9_9EURO|nr:Peptidase_S9 domain-containing protein [Penicillium ucsense]KAF7737176.1 Peptidase_S9 domain-containing protein [Penicillium ucsense]